MPHSEHLILVSIFCPTFVVLALHFLHHLGSFANPFSRKNRCSSAEKANIEPHWKHLNSLSTKSILLCPCGGNVQVVGRGHRLSVQNKQWCRAMALTIARAVGCCKWPFVNSFGITSKKGGGSYPCLSDGLVGNSSLGVCKSSPCSEHRVKLKFVGLNRNSAHRNLSTSPRQKDPSEPSRGQNERGGIILTAI